MSNDVTTRELTQEDRLKAIAYQFIALYERWAEDRQLAAKQGADTTELIQLFTEQVKNFKELEPHVRQQLLVSIQNIISGATKKIGEEIGKEANRATEHVTQQLTHTVQCAQQTLDTYQREVVTTQWKIIAISALTTVATCFLLVWLLIPRPALPLTDDQIKDMYGGKLMALVWPKLTKSEQQHWLQLADQAQHPEQTGSSNKSNDKQE